MALKAVLASKADVDALPDAVRGLYKETGGKYLLDVEGMTLDSDVETINLRLAEFRDNNIRLKKDLEKFKDVDPEDYRKVKSEVETLRKGGGKTDESEVQKAIDKALGPIRQELEQAKADGQAKAQALETKELHDALWQVGVKAGVREEAKGFWLSEASKMFKRDGDTIVAFNGDQQVFSKRKGKAGEPMTAEEWALEIAPTQPSLGLLYKDSKGGGARGGDAGAGGARILSRDNAQAISGSLEQIATGAVVIN